MSPETGTYHVQHCVLVPGVVGAGAVAYDVQVAVGAVGVLDAVVGVEAENEQEEEMAVLLP